MHTILHHTLYSTRNTFFRTRSLSNATFFISDYATFNHPVQNLLLCTKFHQNRMIFFTEIWRYIDFQNGGRLPSWDCFTTIRDHPRSLCYWPQLHVKFHVNLIHRLEMPIQASKMGILGYFGPPKCDCWSSRPPKGTSLRKFESFKLSTVKIRWGVWPVGELTESVMDTHTQKDTTGKFIFCPCTALNRQIRG